MSPLWALRLFISVTPDIEMLEREMCQFVLPVGNGTQPLFSVKVIMTLINIPEYWVLGETLQ